MIKNRLRYLLCCLLAASSSMTTARAGIVILSKHDSFSETIIYQNGFAVFLKNGKTTTIVDTNSNNCIVINHNLKQYLYIKCTKYNTLITKKYIDQQQRMNKKISILQQQKLPENKIPKSAITIKRSGRGSYQGYHVEKFKFIVENDVVSEYWMSANLEEKIKKEVNVEKLNKIFKVSDKYKLFKNGLKSKIEKKYNEFKKRHFALKEFRYAKQGTKKIYRHISIKQINIRDHMPPKSFKISSSLSDFIKTSN